IVGSDYGGVRKQRHVDQVVVNHGTRPLDELYFELKPQSGNRGAVDYPALLDGNPQTLPAPGSGGFALYRVGDAVSARNTHAAIYDALRLAKDL
ncbi:MAG TPA: N-methylproline demethylase, partial [Burkholderiaceae bacterium]|nr:N-methylproline demethylase [Burkholderiaceae bacterium]